MAVSQVVQMLRMSFLVVSMEMRLQMSLKLTEGDGRLGSLPSEERSLGVEG
jgi:hypothetical protein